MTAGAYIVWAIDTFTVCFKCLETHKDTKKKKKQKWTSTCLIYRKSLRTIICILVIKKQQ